GLGLTAAGFGAWSERLVAAMSEHQPSIVVVVVGANDAAGFVSPPIDEVGSLAWRTEYRRRVGVVVDIATAGGARLIWVGAANVTDPALVAPIAVQNEVVAAAVADRTGTIFVDAWRRFSTLIPAGDESSIALAGEVFDDRDGTTKAVRDSDETGTTLNRAGQRILAALIADAVDTALVALGADLP
ncbi:MAG TPA: hypothetical protein PLV68_12330, partial [Ilumatobacteraceae bacterium]|nr:hypothetical protein [Ilumatobacteraceae bacterium]